MSDFLIFYLRVGESIDIWDINVYTFYGLFSLGEAERKTGGRKWKELTNPTRNYRRTTDDEQREIRREREWRRRRNEMTDTNKQRNYDNVSFCGDCGSTNYIWIIIIKHNHNYVIHLIVNGKINNGSKLQSAHFRKNFAYIVDMSTYLFIYAMIIQ